VIVCLITYRRTLSIRERFMVTSSPNITHIVRFQDCIVH